MVLKDCILTKRSYILRLSFKRLARCLYFICNLISFSKLNNRLAETEVRKTLETLTPQNDNSLSERHLSNNCLYSQKYRDVHLYI